MGVIFRQIDSSTAFISCVNQLCFEGEGDVIQIVLKRASCVSRLLAEIVCPLIIVVYLLFSGPLSSTQRVVSLDVLISISAIGILLLCTFVYNRYDKYFFLIYTDDDSSIESKRLLI